MELNIKLFFRLFLILVLAGCVEDQGSAPDVPSTNNPAINFSNLTPDCYMPYSSAPLIGPVDDFLTGSTWGDPSVLKVNGEFVMFASSSLYTDPNDPAGSWDQNIKIYRLISANGINWSLSPTSPVFEKSAAGWDRKSVETPSVVYYKGEYHLFYTGYPTAFNDATSYRIGHATSPDGITWTRQTPAGTPLLAPNDPTNATPNLTFDQYIVAEPGAVVFNDKIYVYFAASGTNLEVNTTADVVGLAIYDGATDTWEAQKEVMRPIQSQYPRANNIKGFSTPAAAVINGQVHLYVTAVTETPFIHYEIHHAYSTDGETNWVQDSSPILNKAEQTWHSYDLISPSALYDDGKVYLWYGGNQGSLDSLGIGLSICNLRQ